MPACSEGRWTPERRARGFRNYALPDDDARPTEAQVAELVAVFTSRSRTPRLEFLPGLCPDVEPGLRGRCRLDPMSALGSYLTIGVRSITAAVGFVVAWHGGDINDSAAPAALRRPRGVSQLSGTPTLAELASTNLARTKSAVAMNAVAVIVAMVTTMYAVSMVELLVARCS